MDWPADKVTKRKVSSLVPSAQNARTHTEAQIAQIGASITEWVWTIPVLVDEVETILAGHGRVLAAQLLGLDNIPVMVAKGWSEEQKRAYVLADNKLAENAGWDMDALRVELTDLSRVGVDLGLIGFSQGELNALVAPTGGHTGEDDAPEAQDGDLVFTSMKAISSMPACGARMAEFFQSGAWGTFTTMNSSRFRCPMEPT